MSWICVSETSLYGCVATIRGVNFDASRSIGFYLLDGRVFGSDNVNRSYCWLRPSTGQNANSFQFDYMSVSVNGINVSVNQSLDVPAIDTVELSGFGVDSKLKNIFGRYATASGYRQDLEGSFEEFEFNWGEGDPRNFKIFGKVNADFALQPQQLPCLSSFESDVYSDPDGGSNWLKSGNTYTALVENAELQITASLDSKIIDVDVDLISGDSVKIAYTEYTGNAYSSTLSEIPLLVGNNKKIVHLGHVASARIIAAGVGDSFAINSVREVQRGIIMGSGAIWKESEIA